MNRHDFLVGANRLSSQVNREKHRLEELLCSTFFLDRDEDLKLIKLPPPNKLVYHEDFSVFMMKVNFLEKGVPYEVYEPTKFATKGKIQYDATEKKFKRTTVDDNGRYCIENVEPIILD